MVAAPKSEPKHTSWHGALAYRIHVEVEDIWGIHYSNLTVQKASTQTVHKTLYIEDEAPNIFLNRYDKSYRLEWKV
jgi:hypothetical protein